jgi:hypothetical protein
MEQHKEALKSLKFQPLNTTDFLVSAFIKKELLRAEKDYDPRLISSFSARFNVFFGPMLYSWGKSLSSSWNKDHFILYTSGSRAEDISDWVLTNLTRMGVTIDDVDFIYSDEKRQDSHVTCEAYEFEFEMFEFMGIPTWFVNELRKTTKVHGITKNHGHHYFRKGGRNSGQPNTSSGNSHMNAIKFIYSLWLQKPWDWSNIPFCLCVQGDDNLCLMRKDYSQHIDVDPIVQTSAQYGFEIKICQKTSNIYEIDYCSKIFYPVATHPLGYILGPKIGKVLFKIGFAKKKVKDSYAHNRGIALSLWNDVQQIPILSTWVEKLMQLTEGVTPIEQPYDHGIHARQPHTATDEVYELMYHRYNITALDIEAINCDIESVPSLPYHVPSEMIEHIVVVDYTL